jgi:hypothetical protein
MFVKARRISQILEYCLFATAFLQRIAGLKSPYRIILKKDKLFVLLSKVYSEK